MLGIDINAAAIVSSGPRVTGPDGVIINSGTIVSVIHGWNIAYPLQLGQVFLPVSNVNGMAPGQISPGVAVKSSGATATAAAPTSDATINITLWPSDTSMQSLISNLSTVIGATGGFPGGATSWPVKDLSGAVHSLTVAQFNTVAIAVANYIRQQG
jgi:hypothetical protein